MADDEKLASPTLAQVPDIPVSRDVTESVLGMGVTPGSSLDQALQLHRAQRTAQAQIYRTALSSALGQKYKGTKWDPSLNGGAGGERPLTEQENAVLEAQIEHATNQYNKMIGVNPQAKSALEKAHGIIDTIFGHKQQQDQQKQQRPGGMAAPPTPQYGASVTEKGVIPTPAPGVNVGEAGVAITPPPPSPRQPSMLEQAAVAPIIGHEQMVGQALQDRGRATTADVTTRQALVKKVLPESDWNKPYVQDYILTGRITGNMGAALRPPPRPAGSYTTSVLDARKRTEKGEIFRNIAGEILDPSEFDPSMAFKGMQTLNPETGQWEIRYEPFSPNQATVNVGNEVYAVSPMDKSKMTEGAGTALGPQHVPTTSIHTAPGVTLGGEIGTVTTGTTKVPATVGITGRTQSAPSAAPSGPAGQAAPTTPRVTGRPGAGPPPPTPQAPTGPATRKSGAALISGSAKAGKNEQAIPFGAANQLNQRIIPVREAATQLFGDPTQPEFKGFQDYAYLADNKNKDERDALANAVRLTLDHMKGEERTSGSLYALLGNYLGKPQALVDSETGVMQDVIGKLSPQNQEAYNAIMSTYGTVMGLRSLTRASSHQFSVQALEREIPIPGINTFSKEQFYDKMSRLAEQVYNGSKTVPLPKEEKDFYANKVSEYRKLASGRGGIPPPPTPGATATPIKDAAGLLNKYGIKQNQP